MKPLTRWQEIEPRWTTPAGKQILFHLLPRVLRSWFPARLQLQIEIPIVYLSLEKPPSKQIFEVLMYIHVLLDKISTDAKLRPKQQETSYPSREEGVVLLEIKKTQLATISLLQYHSTHLRLIPSKTVADVAETWMKRNDDWLIRTMILFYSTTYLRIKLWQTLPEVLEPPWIHCPRLNPSLHSSSQRLSSRLHASTNNLCVQGAQRDM